MDTQKIRKLIRDFKSDARPDSSNDANPYTVRDANRMVSSLIEVLNAIADELDQPDQ